MPSTFMGIEIARRGVAAHQLALQTTGHNISNADNPHYSRQRVNLQAIHPLYDPSLNRPQGPGMLGQGVEAASIEEFGTTLLIKEYKKRNKVALTGKLEKVT